MAAALAQSIQRLAHGSVSDAELLTAFRTRRDETAFAELVRRHGPLVAGVCSRKLGRGHDAEDAFQAAFLVLARKAHAVQKPERLAGWLHTVALRAAHEVRSMRQRQRRADAARPVPEAITVETPSDDLSAILDEELAKLPEPYRLAIVRCELQGQSRSEAAAALKIPAGTLSSRLAEAKRRLARRLRQRGITASVAAITAAAMRADASWLGLRPDAVAQTAVALLAGRQAGAAAAIAIADTVVKSMLVSKLKGVAVATLVVALLGGGLTLVPTDRPGGAAAQAGETDRTNPPAQADIDKLIRDLGATDFGTRESARKKLRDLGAAALPAVRSGIKNPNPEIARRCETLEADIRADRLNDLVKQFKADGTEDYDHPVWQRYKKLIGNDAASRKLFAEIIAERRRATMLDEAAADSNKRAKLYQEEASRQSLNSLYAVAKQMPGGYRLLEGGPSEKELQPPPEAITNGSMAAYFLLGSYPESAVTIRGNDRAGRPIRDGLIVETFAFSNAGSRSLHPLRTPLRRLFAEWVEHRVDRDTLETAFWRATMEQIAEAVPAARRLVTSGSLPVEARAYAALLLGRCGDRTDLVRLAQLLEIKTVARKVEYDRKPAPVQVRDAALAASLLICRESPAEYGFDVLRVRNDPKNDAHDMAWLGFWSDESREATHKKGKEFLSRQPRVAVDQKQIDNLIRQLGDASFAVRETAREKLVELGAPSLKSLRREAQNRDPDIARHCDIAIAKIHTLESTRRAFKIAAGMEDPVWTRFKAIVGDDLASRKLFDEMMATPLGKRAAESAIIEPETAGKFYSQLIALQKAERELAFREMMRTTGIPDPNAKANWAPIRGAWAAVLFLGSFPDTAKAIPDTKTEVATFENIAFPPGELIPPTMRKLFLAWGVNRGTPESIRYALECGLNYDIPEYLPFARKCAIDEKLPIVVRATALQVLAQFGQTSDLATMKKFLGDQTLFIRRNPETTAEGAPGNLVYVVQVRDVAAVMMLKLLGRKPDEFGFRYGLVTPAAYVNNKYYTIAWGFLDTPDGVKAREAAHQKMRID